ncbi:MAG: AraC family transcriptional regulator [Paenibacillaceae bacterium]|jgi:AraC-like DNA-binding protein|nr:AraC family transcriptional regulator [Paenibacillaceae bacterium]
MEKAHSSSPRRMEAPFNSLNPTVHWAQKHIRFPDMPWSRRIYDFEIIYVLHGESKLLLHSQEYRVETGNLLYLPAGIHHDIRIQSHEMSYLGVHFDYNNDLQPQLATQLFIKSGDVPDHLFCREPILKEFASSGTNTLLPPVMIPPSQTPSLMENIIAEFNQLKPGFAVSCKGLLLHLLALLLRDIRQTPKQNVKYADTIEEIIRQMEEQYMENWTYERIAAQCNLNQDYFAKLFKERTGRSPNKYLQYVRHQRSKQLLRETDLKVEAISRMVGYDDFHYFSRSFKKWEGMSPQHYRTMSALF